MHWIHHTKTHLKRLRVQVSIPFITKDIAILRLSVTGGGDKVDEKHGNSFFQFLRVNIKKKLFKFYMKKSEDVYVLHNCVYYIHFTVIVTHCLASIALF